MNKLLTGAMTGAMMLSGVAAQAGGDVVLQLKWVTQAQFAGYYVALDNGFYADEGLDVTIKPGALILPPHRFSPVAVLMLFLTGCLPPLRRVKKGWRWLISHSLSQALA